MSAGASFVADLRTVLAGRDFRRLFTVRLVSQAGDGMFQVALASLFFFSPERAASTAGVAGAIAVLLLPFTLVGPWVGVVLDRWRRRQVLAVANLVRAAMVIGVAALLLTTGAGPALYVAVLLCLSVNRLLLAALSASLPHVVPRHELTMANAVSPTCGSVAAFLGGGLAFALRAFVGTGDSGDARLLVIAAGVFALAGLAATRMDRDLLGPDDDPTVDGARPSPLSGVPRALAHLWERRSPAHTLLAIGAHRFAYGLTTIATILLARNKLSEPGDTDGALALLGLIVGASGVGFALAAVVTPVVVRYWRPQSWIVATFTLAAATESVFTIWLNLPLLVVGAVILGFAAQGSKICVDTIVQRDTDDAFRGRVFTFYDVVFNASFVSAAALAVLVVPSDGYSKALYGGIATLYLVTAIGYRAATARLAATRPTPQAEPATEV